MCFLLINLSRLNMLLINPANSEVYLKKKKTRLLVSVMYIKGCEGRKCDGRFNFIASV